ncbi:hypothetical protein [Psychromarinibacter halotolerans]|uniref:Uncharacterized protein n=1 Tax=Psychromarinibacter halotolerans TaxID=1775175 RepID=A0ABV7GX75_9RHOB|nr:hypothetical protein [Psychromarinibacter halotolerans]MDF0598145.1 hypothetical protein [Psychromarinibacter halotolerans]
MINTKSDLTPTTGLTTVAHKIWTALNPAEPSPYFLVGFMACSIMIFAAGLAIGGHI